MVLQGKGIGVENDPPCILCFRFSGIPGPTGYSLFDYNPCAPFTSSVYCTNVQVSLEVAMGINQKCKWQGCQRFANSNGSYAIADFGSEQMMMQENGDVFLHYLGGNGGSIRLEFYWMWHVA